MKTSRFTKYMFSEKWFEKNQNNQLNQPTQPTNQF